MKFQNSRCFRRRWVACITSLVAHAIDTYFAYGFIFVRSVCIREKYWLLFNIKRAISERCDCFLGIKRNTIMHQVIQNALDGWVTFPDTEFRPCTVKLKSSRIVETFNTVIYYSFSIFKPFCHIMQSIIRKVPCFCGTILC